MTNQSKKQSQKPSKQLPLQISQSIDTIEATTPSEIISKRLRTLQKRLVLLLTFAQCT